MLYLLAAVGFSVTVTRPEFVALSFAGAFAAAVANKGRKAVGFTAKLCLPVAGVAALVNPLFNHLGVTIWFYLGNNPVTAEAFVYGCAAGGMLAAVLLWFYALGGVLTGEGFTALIGKVLPKTALTLSVALGCEPKIRGDVAAIAEARALLGEKKTLRHGLKTLDTALGCALEDSVQTAAQMRARGFGLKPRKRYKPRTGGTAFCIVALLLTGACLAGRIAADPYFYYPVYTVPYAPADIVSAVSFGLLCFLPAAFGLISEWKWRCLKSKI